MTSSDLSGHAISGWRYCLPGGKPSGKAIESVALNMNGMYKSAINGQRHFHLYADFTKFAISSEICKRERCFNNLSRSFGDMGMHMDSETVNEKKENLISKFKAGIFELAGISLAGSSSGRVESDIIILALPAIFGQAVEPLAQLMEMAYVGRLGSLELASAAVSVSIFNTISKLFNVPLLSITTSYVAEDISRSIREESVLGTFHKEKRSPTMSCVDREERRQLPSVSTALLLATIIGSIEAVAMYLGSGFFLRLMGVSSDSPMYNPAQRFLLLRAIGAPAVVSSLAIQGVFRGFKDTQTPLFCVGLGNLSAFFLLPLCVHYFRLGIIGAATATVSSQYIISFLLIWFLNKKAILLPPKVEKLQFGSYLKSGGLLLGRTLSVTTTMTLGTSMAARQGPVAIAAHQICMQVWLAFSLLSDALAVSSQALIASSISNGNFKRVKEITHYVLKTGLCIGIILAVVLYMGLDYLAQLFTKDANVVQIIKSLLLYVSATQPLNALAFVFDGLHYGVSDFSYAAVAMMMVGMISSAVVVYAPRKFGLLGIWYGLTIFMALRVASGFLRIACKSGPWGFLHQ